MTTSSKTGNILWGGFLAGVGFLIGSYLTNKRLKNESETKDKAILPKDTQCPKEGVVFEGKIPSCMEPKVWVFIANHCVNLEFFNKIMFDTHDDGSYHKTISFPVRLRAEGGFLRAWGLRDDKAGR
jgi:hypothetical protein